MLAKKFSNKNAGRTSVRSKLTAELDYSMNLSYSKLRDLRGIVMNKERAEENMNGLKKILEKYIKLSTDPDLQEECSISRLGHKNAFDKSRRSQSSILERQRFEKKFVEKFVEKFEGMMEMNILSEKELAKVLRYHIEYVLHSKLKHYYIKVIASRIKNDGEEPKWLSLVKTEVKNVRKQLKRCHIQMYLKHLTAYPTQKLCDYFEKICQSPLRSYLESRISQPELKDSYDAKIQDEWEILSKDVNEKYICLYCTVVLGPMKFLEH